MLQLSCCSADSVTQQSLDIECTRDFVPGLLYAAVYQVVLLALSTDLHPRLGSYEHPFDISKAALRP